MTQLSDIVRLREAVRSVPDFPKPGIVFRDLTPIMQDPELNELMMTAHVEAAQEMTGEDRFDLVVGMESRGFWYGPLLAWDQFAGFVPARKPGKLPGKVVSVQYGLEYGKDELQIHEDAIKPGQRVLIVDDLLATGGTAEAVGKLVTGLGGVIAGYLFAIELEALGGRARLPDVPCEAILKF